MSWMFPDELVPEYERTCMKSTLTGTVSRFRRSVRKKTEPLRIPTARRSLPA
jgi:hypothetical protein